MFTFQDVWFGRKVLMIVEFFYILKKSASFRFRGEGHTIQIC